MRLQLGYTLIFCFNSFVIRLSVAAFGFLMSSNELQRKSSERRISSVSDPVCFDAFEDGMMCGFFLSDLTCVWFA